MACPYFYPLRRHAAKSQALPLPLPLGDAWTGVCRSAADPPLEPEAVVLDSICCLGYARGRCQRFPNDDAGPDAVRFTITRDSEASLEVHYVLERDHHPFAHGRLRYLVPLQRFQEEPAGEILARQAAAYVESYLWRRAAAAHS
jgi:hypothetical protein